MRKQSLIVASLILSIFVSSCARVQIKDSEWCGDKGEKGAKCFHTLTDAVRVVPKEQWDDERFGQICGSEAAFSEVYSELTQLCRVTKICTYEEKEALKRLGKFLTEIIEETRR